MMHDFQRCSPLEQLGPKEGQELCQEAREVQEGAHVRQIVRAQACQRIHIQRRLCILCIYDM